MTRSAPEVSRHVSVWIEAKREAVYAFAADQRTLAEWAAGLADPKLAPEVAEFAPPDEFGFLDHVVRLPSGEQVFNAMRINPAVTENLLRLTRLTER